MVREIAARSCGAQIKIYSDKEQEKELQDCIVTIAGTLANKQDAACIILEQIEEFKVLVNELEKYNPELLDKKFIIAISKSDMLDEELKAAISSELPKDIQHVFISSVLQKGLQELKDILWENLLEENKDK